MNTKASILPLLCLLASPMAQAQEWRLGNQVQPTRQSVYLEVDPAAESFGGSTDIQVKVNQTCRAIRFNALDIKVTRAELIQGKKRTPLQLSTGKYAILSASAAQPIAPGQYSLHLEFAGPFNHHSAGLYKYTDQGLPFLSSQFEMADARRCFPCFDEPCFKIPYQLTISAPKDQVVYNNCAELKRIDQGAYTVHTFGQTLPIPSYLVALAIGPFEQVAVKGMSVPGHIVAPKGKTALAQYSQKETPAILNTLENYFGTKYPYKQLNQLAISEFPFGAMENPGMVTYREDTLLVNEATAQTAIKTEVVRTISHELAHQWFGNQVTMKWWNDLWLNEAFATWMAAKVTAKLHPEFEVQLAASQNEVMKEDANLTTRPIRKEVRTDADIWDGLQLAYSKGCAVLNMVEGWLGEETFKRGMRAYMAQHRFANAEAADLWNALGAASQKNVAGVLESFTSQSGYPLLTLTPQGKTLKVSQSRFTLAGAKAAERLWKVPLAIRYGAGQKQAVVRVLLDQKATTVQLDFEPEWILPDDGGVGYFRWTLPQAQLTALLKHIDKLSNLEKICVIHNLDGLQAAGVMSAGDGLAALDGFLADPHPMVASLALKMLLDRRQIFVNDTNREAWKQYLGPRLKPLRDRIGLVSREREPIKIKDLRSGLLNLYARDIDDPVLMETARVNAMNFIDQTVTVDPALSDCYLRLAAYRGDLALLEKARTALVAAGDPQRRTSLLCTLSSFAVPEVQNKSLDLMLDEAVTASDLRFFLILSVDEEPRRQRLQQWLFKNFAAFRKKLPEAHLGHAISGLAGAHDREQLQAMRDFFLQQPDPNGVIKREVEKLTETVSNNIAYRERGQASFDAVLKK